MPVIINEVDIVLEPPDEGGETTQSVSASLAFDDAALDSLLRYLSERQRRLLAD